MLNSDDIRRRNLVQGAIETSFRGISYDLRVGKVVKPGGDLADSYIVPPQGIVEIVSEERLTLPMDLAGVAMVKTSLSNQGLLALNIGIVDPGYEGRLGSFFVNFGKRDHILRKGDVFLRVVFHEVRQNEESEKYRPGPVPDEKSLADRRSNMELNFGTDFLNVADITEKFARKQLAEYRTKLFTYAAPAALLLAAMTFFLNFGNLLLVQRFLQPSDITRAELLRQSLERTNGDLSNENRALVEEVRRLERSLGSTLEDLDEAKRRIDGIEFRMRADPAQQGDGR